jgi:hypothetical protein
MTERKDFVWGVHVGRSGHGMPCPYGAIGKGGVRRSPSSLRINMLRHHEGKGSQQPRGIRKGRAS